MQRTSRAVGSETGFWASWPDRLLQSLRAELRVWAGALADRRLGFLLAAALLLLLLAIQAPLHYTIQVGLEDGYGADLPLLVRFNTPERDDHGRFRWTGERSIISLPGLGRRPVSLKLTVFPIGPEVALIGPKQISLTVNGATYAELPVRPEGAIYHVALPPAALASGRVELRSSTFSPAGDPRQLGVPLTGVEVRGLAGGPVLPSLRLLLAWLSALLLLWLLLRRFGFPGRSVFWLLLPVAVLLALATALDPPRTAMGAGPLLASVVAGYCVGLPLLALLPLLARWLDLPLGLWALRWLVVLVVLVVGLRYGAKLYPYSMPGDIGFHVNRSNDVLVRGQFILIIPHRGVDFPYPPSFYLLTAPLRLLGLPADRMLQFSAALLDGISALLIYTLAVASWRQLGRRPWPALGVLAAAIYSLTAAGFMAYWWNFSTFIFAQFSLVLLITTLVLAWPSLVRVQVTGYRLQGIDDRESGAGGRGLGVGERYALLWVAATLTLFLLSHSTALMNATLLGGAGFGLLLLASWRFAWARATFIMLLACFVGAQLVAFAVYYSNYLAMLLGQFQQLAGGGLTGLANRAPVPPEVLWRTLWYDGLITHFGFFPLLLAPFGLLLLASKLDRRDPAASILPYLMGIILLLGLGFAVLPFVSGSTLATRYLMSAAWAVAIGAALVALMLRQRGLMGRLVVLAMAGFVLWVTAAQWLAALAWRIRPPEPF